MLEQIGHMRWHALPEQQTGRDETIHRRSQPRLRLAHHRGEQGMGKLATDRRRDLCQLLGWAAKPELTQIDRKSTRLNSSHLGISYAVFCLKKKKKKKK